MAQLSVNDLSFYYDGSSDPIFEHVTFSIDTDWKLGLIGRNGKGKTTFLNLLRNRYEYSGKIQTSTVFDYFPYPVQESDLALGAAEFIDDWKCGCEQWRVICELNKMGADAEILYRPYGQLSFGERTKVMLAVLFSSDNHFLLIDEPTNHLDQMTREQVKTYLSQKSGFILVSHDRDVLDACVDHVLVLNRCSIEVQNGNFSSWWKNKSRQDAYARSENEKHLKEIGKLKVASEQTRQWARNNENTKIGFDPIKEHDRCISTRAFIGAKTKKMQSRVKQMEKRIGQQIEEKEGLLQDIELPVDLKLTVLEHDKKRLLSFRHYGLRYADSAESSWLIDDLNLELNQGERIFLNGANGCGKSSLIKAVLQITGGMEKEAECTSTTLVQKGILETASRLTVSYVSQDTSSVQGTVKTFCKERKLDESTLCAILRQLDFGRSLFTEQMQNYSEGQKKKVLIAASLLTPAHLYLWDEPFNYIDVFSRMQIEKLLLSYQPTMLVVEHDVRFREKIATRVVNL